MDGVCRIESGFLSVHFPRAPGGQLPCAREFLFVGELTAFRTRRSFSAFGNDHCLRVNGANKGHELVDVGRAAFRALISIRIMASEKLLAAFRAEIAVGVSLKDGVLFVAACRKKA